MTSGFAPSRSPCVERAEGSSGRTRAELDWRRSRPGHADLALFHEFAPAPSGGGHQFLRALTHELDGRGLAVELNRISGRTPACLFNSFNFDFTRLRRFADRGARMVHRVDGPIGAYRGFDDGTDARIAEVNAELASATIFQSEFSLDEAPRARLRAARAGRHPERGRPGDLPSSDEPRSAGREAGAAGRERAGRTIRARARRRSPGSTGTSTPTASSSRSQGGRPPRSSTSASSARSTRTRSPTCSGRRTRTSLRAATTRARTHCSKRSRAACPPCTARAAGTRSSSARAVCRFETDEELGDVLDRLVAELDERRAAISTPSLASVADSYLEVLGLRAAT